VEWIKVAQIRDQKRDLGTEGKTTVSFCSSSDNFSSKLQVAESRFSGKIATDIDIGCSYLKGT
jgi:hypothetical protein